nr:GGDEF domain-containing protein [Vibrio sp. RE86]
MSFACFGLLVYVINRSTQYQRRNKELCTISSTDPLTGLKNRRYYKQWIEEQMQNERMYTLVVVDLDYFKSINDEHGHDVGDEILIETASRLRASTPSGSQIIRWGGEEFTCLMPYSIRFENDLEAVRQSICAQPMKTRVGAINTSITLGAVGPIQAKQLSQNSDHFLQADKALYQGKSEGRNRVIFKHVA